MTRTERSSYPRALNKDRSENKSGLQSQLRKGGAGAHNWGSLHDELDHEADLLEEEYLGEEEGGEGGVAEGVNGVGNVDGETASIDTKSDVSAPSGAVPVPVKKASNGEISEAARNEAREYRKGAFKGGNVDLSAIARTSVAASTSPTSRSPIANFPIHVGTDAPTAKV